MTHAENKVEWCLKKAGKEGTKHRGLKEISQNKIKAEEHIKKSEHNLRVMEYLIQGEFNDWAVSASFYVHYHCLLAILQKFGYESRNQECTFAAIEHLIEKNTISLSKEELHKIFKEEHEEKLQAPDIIGLREFFQYGTLTDYEKEKIKDLLKQSKNFVEKTKIIIES